MEMDAHGDAQGTFKLLAIQGELSDPPGVGWHAVGAFTLPPGAQRPVGGVGGSLGQV